MLSVPGAERETPMLEASSEAAVSAGRNSSFFQSVQIAWSGFSTAFRARPSSIWGFGCRVSDKMQKKQFKPFASRTFALRFATATIRLWSCVASVFVRSAAMRQNLRLAHAQWQRPSSSLIPSWLFSVADRFHLPLPTAANCSAEILVRAVFGRDTSNSKRCDRRKPDDSPQNVQKPQHSHAPNLHTNITALPAR